ncbi:hypothetical protein [Marinicella meishanensis]|uniref:hypothetical protein n=1 Tax=Marinicella meishanensis TaxID=2873263 RepID=UPI001CBCFE2B|nr:hypothetical protein [Marinicella sp. NBU2979]
MKQKLGLILGCLLVSVPAVAERYFALKYAQNKQTHHSTLLELNAESGAVMQEWVLGEADHRPVQKMALPAGDSMFFYAEVAKKQAQVVQVSVADRRVLPPVAIDPLNKRLQDNGLWYRFMHLSEDQTRLYLHTGHKKTQQLTVIDVVNNRISQQIPLNKHDHEVRLSADQQYLIITDLKKNHLSLYSLALGAVVFQQALGKRGHFGLIHQHHVYLTRFDGRHRDTRNSVADHMFGTNLLNDFSRTKYWVEVTDLTSQKQNTIALDSTYAPAYAVQPAADQVWVLSTTDKDKTAVLTQLHGTQATELKRYDVAISPEALHYDEAFNRLLVIGGHDLALINLNDLDQLTLIDRPFDVVDHVFSSDGQQLYLKEGVGSEVAVVAVDSGQILGRSGTGRPGVKVGHAMATVALAAATGSQGFGVYVAIYSNTGMILDASENHLYVINSKTHDVTRFQAKDLSDRQALPTGRGTFLVYQSEGEDRPVWVFSQQQVNQIDNATFKPDNTIEYEALVGLDWAQDSFTIQTKDHLQVMDLKTGAVRQQWPITPVDYLWSQ